MIQKLLKQPFLESLSLTGRLEIETLTSEVVRY